MLVAAWPFRRFFPPRNYDGRLHFASAWYLYQLPQD
jgi:hypothetical protein